MATLHLRGMGSKDVPYEAAKAIKDQIENKMLKNDEWVSFGNFSCKAGSIVGVVLDSEFSDKGGNKEVENEYYEDRMRILRQTPEERSERLGFFKLFYKIMTGDETTQEIDKIARDIQLGFFRKNPYRLEADPQLFRELVGVNSAKIGQYFHLIERIIRNDMDMVKYKLG